MATPEAKWKKTSSVAGATLALVALAGSVGTLDGLAGRSADFLSISLRVAREALPAIPLAAWQILVPYLLRHWRVLEGLLQISAFCWQLLLVFAQVA